MEFPALSQVLLHALLGCESPQVAERLLHVRDLAASDGAGAEPGGEALEAEPCRVDLLEVLARQPAHDGAPGRGDGDEALALELAQPGADRGRRNSELLREIALHERRPLRQLPVDDQVTERARDLLLDRLALLERENRRRRAFHAPTACSMLAGNAICYCKSQMNGARIGVDVGGTFTDVILHEADGRARVHKLLSTPPTYDRAVVDSVTDLIGNGNGTVGEVVHGTTVATNAVIERLGAETALVTTRHFRDVLELRRLRIPHIATLRRPRGALLPTAWVGEPATSTADRPIPLRQCRSSPIPPGAHRDPGAPGATQVHARHVRVALARGLAGLVERVEVRRRSARRRARPTFSSR